MESFVLPAKNAGLSADMKAMGADTLFVGHTKKNNTAGGNGNTPHIHIADVPMLSHHNFVVCDCVRRQ